VLSQKVIVKHEKNRRNFSKIRRKILGKKEEVVLGKEAKSSNQNHSVKNDHVLSPRCSYHE